MKIFILRRFPPGLVALAVVAAVALLIVGLGIYPQGAEAENQKPHDLLNNKTVAIDPGHGGADPGAVGVTGALEKEINLKLAEYLQKYLEKNGAKVVLTREDDAALGDTKKEDLDARAEIVTTAQADIFISMQCNAIPDQSCKGAQVFYYPQSSQGEALAMAVQSRLWSGTDQEKQREAQTISAPYILKAVEIPAVIVEAGFLSNPQEEELLITEEYQKKVAKSVYQGILDYYKDKPVFFSLF